MGIPKVLSQARAGNSANSVFPIEKYRNANKEANPGNSFHKNNFPLGWKITKLIRWLITTMVSYFMLQRTPPPGTSNCNQEPIVCYAARAPHCPLDMLEGQKSSIKSRVPVWDTMRGMKSPRNSCCFNNWVTSAWLLWCTLDAYDYGFLWAYLTAAILNLKACNQKLDAIIDCKGLGCLPRNA